MFVTIKQALLCRFHAARLSCPYTRANCKGMQIVAWRLAGNFTATTRQSSSIAQVVSHWFPWGPVAGNMALECVMPASYGFHWQLSLHQVLHFSHPSYGTKIMGQLKYKPRPNQRIKERTLSQKQYAVPQGKCELEEAGKCTHCIIILPLRPHFIT